MVMEGGKLMVLGRLLRMLKGPLVYDDLWFGYAGLLGESGIITVQFALHTKGVTTCNNLLASLDCAVALRPLFRSLPIPASAYLCGPKCSR